MEIYVDELPKKCKDCPLHNEDNGWCQVLICYTDDVPTDCPLKPLSDRLAEERKIVCNQARVNIRSLFNSYASSILDYCIWNKNADSNQKLYNNFKRIVNDRLVKVLELFDKQIDQIERGE